ncbi:hypothetical protein PATSB16_16010 [Pandoraea thiooxydans]|nr:hypothetical protein PATSB16_16010 [Pandoraea thiooxydans]
MVSLRFSKGAVGFREYVQWACNIECLYTVECNKGDFHAVTFISMSAALGSASSWHIELARSTAASSVEPV